VLFTVLLLEDEHYTKRYLKQIIQQSPLVSEVIATSSGKEAIELTYKYKPNVAMLDIELNAEENLNGIDTAKMLYNIYPDMEFVFITGYSKYAIDSFAVHPFEYILKPIKKEKINDVLSSLAQRLKRRKEKSGKLILKNKHGTFFVDPQDIIFIEKLGKEALVHSDFDICKVQQTLNEMETAMDKDVFLRVHQSFIVNKKKILKVIDLGNRSYEIEFLNYDKKALMSRYQFEKLKNEFTPSF